jgi:hypothetical protein
MAKEFGYVAESRQVTGGPTPEALRKRVKRILGGQVPSGDIPEHWGRRTLPSRQVRLTLSQTGVRRRGVDS